MAKKRRVKKEGMSKGRKKVRLNLKPSTRKTSSTPMRNRKRPSRTGRKISKSSRVTKKRRVMNSDNLFPAVVVALILLFVFSSGFTEDYTKSTVTAQGPYIPDQVEDAVTILYFRNDGCAYARAADQAIKGIEEDFGSRVIVKTYYAELAEDDPKESAEVTEMRGRYDVIGLPSFVVNGDRYAGKLTADALGSKICDSFIIKPASC